MRPYVDTHRLHLGQIQVVDDRRTGQCLREISSVLYVPNQRSRRRVDVWEVPRERSIEDYGLTLNKEREQRRRIVLDDSLAQE
jgi:hypothetical protein